MFYCTQLRLLLLVLLFNSFDVFVIRYQYQTTISKMPVGTARNIAITPTTKLLKPNTATSLNAKVKSFSTITISISPSTNLFRLTRKVPFYNWRSSNKKAGSLVVLPPKVIKIITTTVMVD